MHIQVAEACDGISGRGLKKLPLLAWAFHRSSNVTYQTPIMVSVFLDMLLKAAMKHQDDTKKCMGGVDGIVPSNGSNAGDQSVASMV